MNISTRLNRDFYIKMRLSGYTHDVITSNVFPPERYDSFCDDVRGLEQIDYTKKLNIDKLVNEQDISNIDKPKKNKK